MPTTTKKRIIFRKKECQEKKTRESKEKEMKDGYKQNRQEKGEERERKCRCEVENKKTDYRCKMSNS